MNYPRAVLIVLATTISQMPHGQAAEACESTVHRLPLPLVGVWQEFTVADDGEILQGELRSHLGAEGCAFHQQFRSVDGTFTFRSLGYVDTRSGRWRERFVLSNGRIAVYEWEPDGTDILLNRLDASANERFRLRITKIQRDYYEVIEERSADRGKTWTAGERTVTRRVSASHPE